MVVQSSLSHACAPHLAGIRRAEIRRAEKKATQVFYIICKVGSVICTLIDNVYTKSAAVTNGVEPKSRDMFPLL